MLDATIINMRKNEFGNSRSIIAEIEIRAPWCSDKYEYSENPEDKEIYARHLKNQAEFYNLNPYSQLQIKDLNHKEER